MVMFWEVAPTVFYWWEFVLILVFQFLPECEPSRMKPPAMFNFFTLLLVKKTRPGRTTDCHNCNSNVLKWSRPAINTIRSAISTNFRLIRHAYVGLIIFIGVDTPAELHRGIAFVSSDMLEVIWQKSGRKLCFRISDERSNFTPSRDRVILSSE